jgi:signal transduction histidine kinase
MRAIAQVIDAGLSLRSATKHEWLDYRTFVTALLGSVFTHFCSGLTIVRSIVKAHGWKLCAESVDQGARYFFTAPVTRKSETGEVA